MSIKAAIMYDFDKTLSEKDMQEYAYISDISLTSEEFWKRCNSLADSEKMDNILAYMYVMLSESQGKCLFTKDTLLKQGAKIKFFNGVTTWFDRIDRYGEKLGIEVEHYIISSGLKKIIEGTSITRHFKEIYACEFCYNEKGVPYWPALAVNYTSKTQFLFRINKGVLDIRDDKNINKACKDEDRRIPFSNMIYIGDGLTDVPCMKLTKSEGGHSIAVYQDAPSQAKEMLDAGRVDFMLKADYSKGSELDIVVKGILDKIAASRKLDMLARKYYIEE